MCHLKTSIKRKRDILGNYHWHLDICLSNVLLKVFRLVIQRSERGKLLKWVEMKMLRSSLDAGWITLLSLRGNRE